MGEFWWGMSPKEEIRHHRHFYPSCKGKCAPILAHMLIGLNVEKNPLEVDCHKDKELEIVYEDEWIVAVNKPAGMLSVPGKNDLDSVCQRLQQLYPQATGPLVVHRLDMATSGILLAAKTKEVHQQLQALFATRQMEKQYTAILQGYHGNDEGDISLPLMPDWNNRPCQMVHPTLGKPALTHFRVIKRLGEKVWITFWPHTGRTHQLRVHAAHAEGLNARLQAMNSTEPRTSASICTPATCPSFTLSPERSGNSCSCPFPLNSLHATGSPATAVPGVPVKIITDIRIDSQFIHAVGIIECQAHRPD